MHPHRQQTDKQPLLGRQRKERLGGYTQHLLALPSQSQCTEPFLLQVGIGSVLSITFLEYPYINSVRNSIYSAIFHGKLMSPNGGPLPHQRLTTYWLLKLSAAKVCNSIFLHYMWLLSDPYYIFLQPLVTLQTC